MKIKMIILVALLMVALQAVSQVNYGTVRTDGFNKITVGAFWSKRPEAKLIHEGSRPPGVDVIILEQDYFVRFIDTENNGRDDNYIVFPKGAIIYYKNGHCYSAKCGNEIEYIAPVENIYVQKVVDSIYVDRVHMDSIYVYKYIYVESPNEPQQQYYNDVVVMVDAGYQQPYYQSTMQCQFYWQPISLCSTWGGGNWNSGNTYIDNSYTDNSYYNEVTNIDNSNTVINPRPKPQPNPGGPVDPPIDPVDPNPGGPVDPPIDPVTPPGENGQDPDLKRGETGTTGNQSRYEPSGLKSASASSRGNSATNNPSRDQQTDTKSVSNRQGNPSNSSTRNSNTVSMDARNSSPVVSSNGKGRVNNPTQNRGNNNSTPQNRTSGNTYSSQRSSSLAQSGGRTNNGPTYKQGGTNSSSNHSKSVGQPSRSPSVSPSGRGSNPTARPAQRQAPSRSPVARSSPSRSPGGNRSMGRR